MWTKLLFFFYYTIPFYKKNVAKLHFLLPIRVFNAHNSKDDTSLSKTLGLSTAKAMIEHR